MENQFYKQAILCLMFAMAEADGKFNDTELIEVITMNNVFQEYAEHDIMALHREYQTRFQDKGFAEICNIMVRQIPQELHMATLSLLADVAVVDFCCRYTGIFTDKPGCQFYEHKRDFCKDTIAGIAI